MVFNGRVGSLMARARKFVVLAVVGCLAVALSSSNAQAALLNLNKWEPDINSGFGTVDYNAGTNTFTASMSALNLDFDGIAPPDHNILGGFYSLTAIVDAVGNASGSISITGTVPTAGMNSGTLLTGTIDAWGYVDGGGEIFEFIFAVTGGDLLPYYPTGLSGPRGGTIIATTDTGFTGDLGLNFSSFSYTAVSDTFPIPEPASIASMLIGGGLFVVGCVWRRRRK